MLFKSKYSVVKMVSLAALVLHTVARQSDQYTNLILFSKYKKYKYKLYSLIKL